MDEFELVSKFFEQLSAQASEIISHPDGPASAVLKVCDLGEALVSDKRWEMLRKAAPSCESSDSFSTWLGAEAEFAAGQNIGLWDVTMRLDGNRMSVKSSITRGALEVCPAISALKGMNFYDLGEGRSCLVDCYRALATARGKGQRLSFLFDQALYQLGSIWVSAAVLGDCRTAHGHLSKLDGICVSTSLNGDFTILGQFQNDDFRESLVRGQLS